MSLPHSVKQDQIHNIGCAYWSDAQKVGHFPITENMTDALLECMQKGEQEGTPSASAQGAPKTPWRTPPPTFAELATPQTAMATAGWQELYNEDSVKAGLAISLRTVLLHLAAFPPRVSFYEHQQHGTDT